MICRPRWFKGIVGWFPLVPKDVGGAKLTGELRNAAAGAASTASVGEPDPGVGLADA